MSVYQHYREHEHPFVDQALSWKNDVETSYQRILTDFLDPREQQIALSILGDNSDIYKYGFHGDEEMERKRLLIVPFYETVSEDDFEVIILASSYPSKFISLQHRDVLGSLMSLGIERKKTGDIFVDDDMIYMMVTKDMASYIGLNLTKIRNASVSFKQIEANVSWDRSSEWETMTNIVSSLRLDVYVKEVYRMSRNKAADYIKNDLVKVNHTNIINPAVQLIEADLISVRGFGRSKLTAINGKTKKDNTVITVKKLKK